MMIVNNKLGRLFMEKAMAYFKEFACRQ